jgi:O-antigen/teichoic acid export membrane protein
LHRDTSPLHALDEQRDARSLQASLSQIARLGGGYVTANTVRMGLAFVQSLVLARGFGPEEFGRWVLWSSWAATLTAAFDAGFGVLVTRDAARDATQGGRLVSAACAVRWTLFAPIGALLWLAADWFAAPDSQAAARRIVGLVAVGLAYGAVAAGFRAWPRWVPYVLATETVGAGVAAVGAILLVARASGATTMLEIAIGVQVLQLAAALSLWRVLDGPSFGSPSVTEACRLLRRAWPFAILGLVANGQARLAPLMLGVLSSAEQLAYLGVASRLVEAIKTLPQAALAGVLPVLSAARSRQEDGRVREAFHSWLNRFGWAAMAVLLVAGYPVLRWLFGIQYLGAWPVLLVLAVGVPPTLANSAREVYLFAAGREDDVARWSAIALAIQAGVALLLIPYLGAPGAAAALLVGELCVLSPLRRALEK